MKNIIWTPTEIKEVDLTAEEIAQSEADKSSMETVIANKEAEDNLKASAKAKLVAGEPLTDAEADTIVL